MTIHYLKGDATRPIGGSGTLGGPAKGRILAHVCNDKGGWGRGFVLALSKRWRQPEKAYRAWASWAKDPVHECGRGRIEVEPFVLGAVQFVPIAEEESDIWVANMIAQHGYGNAPRQYVSYEAVRTCLRKVGKEARSLEYTVHMPRIGCGLGGGEWKEIEPILRDELSDLDVHVYDLP